MRRRKRRKRKRKSPRRIRNKRFVKASFYFVVSDRTSSHCNYFFVSKSFLLYVANTLLHFSYIFSSLIIQITPKKKNNKIKIIRALYPILPKKEMYGKSKFDNMRFWLECGHWTFFKKVGPCL